MSSSTAAIIPPPLSRDRTPRSSTTDLHATTSTPQDDVSITSRHRFPLLMDGSHSPQNVCLISFILGFITLFGFIWPHPLATYASAIALSMEMIYLGRAITNKAHHLFSFVWDEKEQVLLCLSLGVCEYTIRGLFFSRTMSPWWIFWFIRNTGKLCVTRWF